MSTPTVASRPRRPKVVPLNPKRSTLATRAQVDLEVEAEILAGYLRGFHELLEGLIQLDHAYTLQPGDRDRALTVLGITAQHLAERLEAKVTAVRAAHDPA